MNLVALLESPGVRNMPTPFFVISGEAFTNNLDRVLGLAGSVEALRPHVKTARCSWAIRQMIERGVGNFKASTLPEAAALGECGAKDVLLAYPLSGSAEEAFTHIRKRYPDTLFSVLVDSRELVASWGSPMDVFIDVDTGMGRTGISTDSEDVGLGLAADLRRHGHRLRGLHSYDGHVAALDEDGRVELVRNTTDKLSALTRLLQEAGHPIGEVVVAGTHSLIEACSASWTLPEGTVVRFGPGTLLFGDTRSRDLLPADAGFTVAAGVVSQVISCGRGRVTVDAGLTSIQTDAGMPHLEVAGREDLIPLRASQEHLVLEPRDSTVLPVVGDRLLLLPRHIDTALIQFPHVLVIDAQGGTQWQPTIQRRPRP